MTTLTVCYPAGTALDLGYYFDKHLPLADAKLRAVGLRKEEVRTISGTVAGTPSPYQLITTLYFDDLAAVQHGLASPEAQAVIADIPNFFAGQPLIMIGEVAAER